MEKNTGLLFLGRISPLRTPANSRIVPVNKAWKEPA